MIKIAPFEVSLLTYLQLTHADNVVYVRVVASTARVLNFLVGLECQEENRPFSGQQRQAQFGLNPALMTMMIYRIIDPLMVTKCLSS